MNKAKSVPKRRVKEPAQRYDLVLYTPEQVFGRKLPAEQRYEDLTVVIVLFAKEFEDTVLGMFKLPETQVCYIFPSAR